MEKFSSPLPKVSWSSRFGESRSPGWVGSPPAQGKDVVVTEPSWMLAAGNDSGVFYFESTS